MRKSFKSHPWIIFFFDKKLFAISHSIQNWNKQKKEEICKFKFDSVSSYVFLPMANKKLRKKLLCSNLRLFACDDDINLELIYFLLYQDTLGVW